MIRKEYRSNINVHKPRNYFERWYADVWRKSGWSSNVAPSVFWQKITEELRAAGGEIVMDDAAAWWTVEFDDDRDYTAFVLRWT